jgi:hypothetical protein
MILAFFWMLFISSTTTSQRAMSTDISLRDEPAPVISTQFNSASSVREYIKAQAIESGVDVSVALRIASCEGGLRQFNPDGSVLRGIINPHDIGIFQINEKYHLKNAQKLGFDIFTQKGNVDYAIDLMEKEGTNPWNWSKDCWSR